MQRHADTELQTIGKKCKVYLPAASLPLSRPVPAICLPHHMPGSMCLSDALQAGQLGETGHDRLHYCPLG